MINDGREKMRDVLIIGSGPAGITAAIYAKRANLDVLLLEKEYEGTGQIAESPCVDNYPGLPGISGYELGERFLNHAKSWRLKSWRTKPKALQNGKIFSGGAEVRKLSGSKNSDLCSRSFSSETYDSRK